jgi:WD40 repeat protein
MGQLAKSDLTYPVAINSVAVSQNGREIAAGYDDGIVRIFDIAQGSF